MILQLANIVCGFLLAASRLKEFGARETIEKLEAALSPYRARLGLAELILGILALVERLGVLHVPIPEFGSSFPQALPAIAMGLVLGADYFAKYPDIHARISQLKEHAEWIGILGIAVGLGSLLFGCFITVFCRGSFL